MQDEDREQQLERLREEHGQMSALLLLIQELTSRAVRSGSVGDLFVRAFPTLFRCVPFDVGVAVMLEQNLDFYLAVREGDDALVGKRLIGNVRSLLESLFEVSFETTEIVVKGEIHSLPSAGRGEGDGLTHSVHALVADADRTAGVLVLHRAASPFSPGEVQMLEVYARQVSLLLDGIRTRESISRLSETDDLTGIWNRRYLRRILAHEIERAEAFSLPLSLLLYDVDDFKLINDTFGHVIGDVVLSELCATVKHAIRPTDVHARLGGDEFVIVLPHTDLVGARSVGDRLLRQIRAMTIATDEEGAIRCSVSAGIVELRRDGESVDQLIHRADELMYASKRSGKNRYTA